MNTGKEMIDGDRNIIYPKNAPAYYRDWKFSPAVECNGFVFVSGCTGTMENGTVPEGIADQTRQAFLRIEMSLREAGVGFSDIVDMTTYHVGLRDHLAEFRSVKDEFISEPHPAWTAIGVSELASEGAVLKLRSLR